MPTVAARRFTALLETVAGDGRPLTARELRSLISAKEAIADRAERTLAEDVLALVRYDRELDKSEAGPARHALEKLTGAPRGKLPTALEGVLRRGIPDGNVRVKHYALELDLSGPGPTYPAHAEISLEKSPKGEVILEVDPKRLRIDDVRVAGKAVPFRVENDRLYVNAKRGKRLDIDYHVRASDHENSYGLLHDVKTGGFSTLTWPYMTGALFPSISTTADGVTATISVKVKRGMSVVGAGSDGRGHLQIGEPVPPYAIALYAGKFAGEPDVTSKSGVKVSVHGHGKSVRSKTRREYQRAVADAIDFFSDWLGPYRYGKSLRLVEVGGDFGGMEHAGAVALMVGSLQNSDDAVETAVHETAHHWFGDNLRIATSGEFWMSEGFTNYITYRFLGARDGQKKFCELLDTAREEVKTALQHRKRTLEAPGYTDVRQIFTDIPYELGPWILRMMETELGTERFDRMLAEWYRRHNFDTVSTPEFLAFVEHETGHDFKPFFRAWSTIERVPTFRDRSRIDGERVEVKLAARGEFPPGMKIPLVLEGAREKKTVLVDPAQPMTIDAGFAVKRLRWDPERRVLAEISQKAV